MELAFKNDDSPWDIYVSDEGRLFSVPTRDGYMMSSFGDRNHIKRLMNQGYWDWDNYKITEAGLSVMKGLCCHIYIGSPTSPFYRFGVSEPVSTTTEGNK
ncbi:hypothetical protein EniLVp02_0161 [Vibrio phage EniLVp02]